MAAALSMAAILVLATGCSGPDALPEEESGTPLEEASDACDAGQIGDDGSTLILDMEGKKAGSGELSYEDVMCVLAELDVPDSMMEKFEKTRALDGRQSDSWDGIGASWSYHPDSGLDILLEVE